MELMMKSKTGAALYHRFAEQLPIIDFHCHLQPIEILKDNVFEDLGEIWLAHDHYKWRVMRTFGIDEALITGEASYREKFMAFAGIFPMLVGNPVYGWCQMELKQYFGVEEALGPDTAEAIYARTRALIHEKRMSPRYFIANSNVEFIATTDDPVDDLKMHEAFQADETIKTTIVPAFRPDRAMNIERDGFAAYVAELAEASGVAIDGFAALMLALEKRLVFFKAHGARVTDHGMDNLRYAPSTSEVREAIVKKALAGAALVQAEVDQFHTAFLLEMAALCAKHGYLMQLHFGAYRNVNDRMFARLGADSGFDACDDLASVRDLGRLMNELDARGTLPRLMLYPINSAQFEPVAILAAGFCTEGTRAKVSLGAPWWFNDQIYGIRKQFEAVGQHYPLALSTGMVTDSRSFLSYPRHEVYRRALCDYLGELVERGEYIGGEAALGQVIEAVCYKNAKAYLGL